MLTHLSIRDFLIINQIQVDFSSGFTAITGETGAGKSILLEAIELLLGGKISRSIVRPGAKQSVLSCILSVAASSPIRNNLSEQGITLEEDQYLHIRRVIDQDNKSKIYVNDQLVTLGFLKSLAPFLIIIHDQFEDMISSDTQREVLDTYANLENQLLQINEIFQNLTSAQSQLSIKQQALQNYQAQKEFLEFACAEMKKLNPLSIEETALIEKRQSVQNSYKIQEAIKALNDCVAGDKGMYDLLRICQKSYEKLQGLYPRDTQLQEILETLHTTTMELEQKVLQFQATIQGDGLSLEEIDDRLHLLRDLGRKYRCHPDHLKEKYEEFERQLQSLEHSTEEIIALEEQIRSLKEQYNDLAKKIHDQRLTAGARLAQQVEKELTPLKLGQARFQIVVEKLPDEQYTSYGKDRVSFWVKTNPGLPLGPLSQIASGGERSRFLLALRVALGHAHKVPTLVFDEIDAGTGGAVASAIGKHLKRLSQNQQLICITHAPQVAAEANMHLRLEKTHTDKDTETTLYSLNDKERIQELARMLSGQKITEASTQAAIDLLKASA